jgi:Ni/Co efflux regulator RcnB
MSAAVSRIGRPVATLFAVAVLAFTGAGVASANASDVRDTASGFSDTTHGRDYGRDHDRGRHHERGYGHGRHHWRGYDRGRHHWRGYDRGRHHWRY